MFFAVEAGGWCPDAPREICNYGYTVTSQGRFTRAARTCVTQQSPIPVIRNGSGGLENMGCGKNLTTKQGGW